MELVVCPECGDVAEVVERFVLGSTDGPVELAQTCCVRRHRFTVEARTLRSALVHRSEPQRWTPWPAG